MEVSNAHPCNTRAGGFTERKLLISKHSFQKDGPRKSSTIKRISSDTAHIYFDGMRSPIGAASAVGNWCQRNDSRSLECKLLLSKGYFFLPPQKNEKPLPCATSNSGCGSTSQRCLCRCSPSSIRRHTRTSYVLKK